MKRPRKHVLTTVQRQLLRALLPGKKLKVDCMDILLYGYIDNQRVCRERTWQTLLMQDYIEPAGSFVYRLTPKGVAASENYEKD